jgi:hypothetical protein
MKITESSFEHDDLEASKETKMFEDSSSESEGAFADVVAPID